MADRFYKLRNTTLLSAVFLVLWRYADLDLSKLKLLEQFSGNVPDRLLAIALLGFVVFINVDMILSFPKKGYDNKGLLWRKQMAFTLGISVLAIFLSLDRFFAQFGFAEVSRLGAASSGALGVILAASVSALVVDVEIAHIFVSMRKCLRLYIVLPLVLWTAIAFSSCGLLLLLRLQGSPDFAFPYTLVFSGFAVLGYLAMRPVTPFLHKAQREKLRKLSDSLNRQVEVSDWASAQDMSKPQNANRLHQHVMRQIGRTEAEMWKNTTISFRWLVDMLKQAEDAVLDLDRIDDEADCIEVNLTHKETGEKQTIRLKGHYFKQAVTQLRDDFVRQKKGRRLLTKPEFVVPCVLLGRELQMLAEADPNDMLIACAHDGSLEKLKALVARQPNINHRGEDGWSALLFSVADGSKDKALYLLQRGADPNTTNQLGAFPLGFAAHYGNVEMCRLLLSYGAHVNQADPGGGTALMKAAAGGHTAVVSCLLEYGAEVSPTNLAGKSALDLAQDGRFGEIAKLLRKKAIDNK